VNRYALDVSFSSQNCNSLNVSTSVRNQAAKIVSILAWVTEIIFLCDIRLNGRHAAISDALRNTYKIYYHSSMNKRGVAVLIKNDLDLQVLEEFRDTEENAIILRVRLRGIELLIGSVYGPNTNQFLLYDFLQVTLNRWRGLPTVLGGDWNAKFSNLPVNNRSGCFFYACGTQCGPH
jgi:exonuclease III